ncbi:hypothetical protein GF361_05500 [Candidatus Woesearchaeota archaeon]|nr:hypothetical protein [Candidatus Woesearchaeota archaeon]
MKAKWLVVFGPLKPEFSLEREFPWLDKKTLRKWEKYAETVLKPGFLEGHKYGFIVTFPRKSSLEYVQIVVTNDGPFYHDLITGDFGGSSTSHLEIRRMELINGSFYCTDPYQKTVEEIRKDWDHKGIMALAP